MDYIANKIVSGTFSKVRCHNYMNGVIKLALVMFLSHKKFIKYS